ncbi:MAG: class I SAM-dependent methyltransferase [Phycisphaerales bacterium]
MPRNTLYEDPVVYDILHGPGTTAEVRGLMRIQRRFVGEVARPVWLEPACGTGRYLRAAKRLGVCAIGFDLSASMIEHAKARLAEVDGPRENLFVADMRAFARAGRVAAASVHLVFCPINTIRHLASDRAMLAHLAEVRRVLVPGGVYAVGLSLSAPGMEFPSEDVWEGGRGACRVKQVVQFVPPTRSGDRWEQAYSHLVVTRGERVEHRDASYRLRCYTQRQWLGLVQRAGLIVRATTDDAGRDVTPGPCGYAVYVLGCGSAQRKAVGQV